jgi:hypothetical protein
MARNWLRLHKLCRVVYKLTRSLLRTSILSFIENTSIIAILSCVHFVSLLPISASKTSGRTLRSLSDINA